MLKIYSLNGARFAGSNREETPQTLLWLRSLSLPGADVPDVLCLQDFRVSLTQYLRPLPYFHFVPMTNAMYFGKRELLGICIASRWPMDHIDIHSTWGDGELRDLQGVDENNERIHPETLSDRLVLQTQNRVAIACTIAAPGCSLRVATHHGFWTRDGAVTEQQLESTRSVASFLSHQAKQHAGLVYLADYNPDKYGKVRSLYLESGAQDCLPSHYATTLAPEHPAARLGIKSDCIMTWPGVDGQRPDVFDVVLDPSPGSDHLMLCASVSPAQREMAGKAKEIMTAPS